jgi:predicted DNA-binding transcriptional regulator AlpA
MTDTIVSALNRFVSVQEAARMIGGNKPVHTSTIYLLVRKGKLPKLRHPSPGISRFDRTELLEAIERQMREADADPSNKGPARGRLKSSKRNAPAEA